MKNLILILTIFVFCVSFNSFAQKPSIEIFFNERPFFKKALSVDTIGFFCLNVQNIKPQNPKTPIGVSVTLLINSNFKANTNKSVEMLETLEEVTFQNYEDLAKYPIENLLKFRDKKGRRGEFLSFRLINSKANVYQKIKLR